MPARTIDDIARPYRRLSGNLAPAAAYTNGAVLWEVIPVRGSARIRARLLCASANGTLDIVTVGPDFDPTQAPATAYASLTGTKHTSGNPTQVAVTAGTEATITHDCYGENFVLLVFTGGGTGTITRVDVSQL